MFTSTEACKWVVDYVRKHKRKLGAGDFKSPARALAEEAQRRWIVRDNAQCIVDDTSIIICWIVSPQSL